MKQKVLSLMGFAARARKIVSGYNTVIVTAEHRKAKLIILAQDLADNSKEKMISLAERCNVPYRIYGEIDELSHITGEEGKGIFAVTDKGFKEAILKEIDEVK